MPNEKRVSDSVVKQYQIIMSPHINSNHRLFGGVLMQWIDVVAAVVARRHSGQTVTTAAVDSLEFKSAAYLDDIVVLEGYLTFVGTTSMEVCVDSFVENKNGEKKHINRAYIVLVAIDANNQPVQVPKLLLETDEQRQLFDAGLRRRALRKDRKKQNY